MGLVTRQELYHDFTDVEFSLDKLHFSDSHYEYGSTRCLTRDETASDGEKCELKHPLYCTYRLRCLRIRKN